VLAEVRSLQAAPPRLLSVEEAAERCGVGRSAFYALIGRGEIRSHKVGRRRLIAETAIQEFIDGDRDP
jgi:excisionase family DNA binding protein